MSDICSALQDCFIDWIILYDASLEIYNHPCGQLVTLYRLCLVSCTMECKQEQHSALASKINYVFAFQLCLLVRR